MVQKLRAIILPRKSENDLKKQILEVIRQTLFEPLLSELEGLAVYYNSKSAIAEALLSGKIEYSNGILGDNSAQKQPENLTLWVLTLIKE